MKIVIDIPEEIYIDCIRSRERLSTLINRAIANGTPLPKEYGDLKDASIIYSGIAREYKEGRLSWGANEIIKDIIGEAPTVIPADKGE